MHEQNITNFLPGWPELMDLSMASAYLSLSERSLRTIAAREAIKPVDLGLRLLRYRKSDLDRLVRDLAAGAGPSKLDESKAEADRIAELALARVAERGWSR